MRPIAHRPSRRGGALILALLFMGVVTTGFVTWITLIRQRARVADLSEHQALKRLSLANAEILARDYLLQRVLASNGDGDGLNTNSDGSSSWSNFTTTSWNGHNQTNAAAWTGYPLDSSTKLAGLNAFSPTYDYPYSQSIDFTPRYRRLFFVENDPSNPTPTRFANDSTSIRGYVRSHNIILGGDLLVLHRPSVTTVLPAITGNVDVYGRVVHFAPDAGLSSYSARSERFTAPGQTAMTVVPSSLTGAALPVSNLTWTPLSAGGAGANLESTSSGDDWRLPNFTGQLNFIDPGSTNAGNSLRAEIQGGSSITPVGSSYADSRGLSINAGIATISPSKGPLTSDLPNILLSQANLITEIVIDGQLDSGTFNSYAAFRPALVVVYTQSVLDTNLTKIILRHQNRRRMILALKKDVRAGFPLPPVEVVVESTTAAPEWHLVILSENVPLNITCSTAAPIPAITGYPNYFASTFRMYGGIQTNAPVTFPAAPKLFEIHLQTDPRGLIKMSPRLSWVETFLNGKL